MKKFYTSLSISLLLMAWGTAYGETSLNYFTATFSEEDNHVKVEWQTAAEVNCQVFILEHSTDGINWTVTGTISGHGNSDMPINYVVIHLEPKTGTNYYRLSCRDYDGNATWFDPISVDCALSGTEELYVYYNASMRDIRVEFYSTEDRPNSILQVMDSNGKLLLMDVLQIVKGKTLWVYKSDKPVSNMYIGTLHCPQGKSFLRKVLIAD